MTEKAKAKKHERNSNCFACCAAVWAITFEPFLHSRKPNIIHLSPRVNSEYPILLSNSRLSSLTSDWKWQQIWSQLCVSLHTIHHVALCSGCAAVHSRVCSRDNPSDKSRRRTAALQETTSFHNNARFHQRQKCKVLSTTKTLSTVTSSQILKPPHLENGAKCTLLGTFPTGRRSANQMRTLREAS